MVSVQYYRFFEIINAVELKISIKLTNRTHTKYFSLSKQVLIAFTQTICNKGKTFVVVNNIN